MESIRAPTALSSSHQPLIKSFERPAVRNSLKIVLALLVALIALGGALGTFVSPDTKADTASLSVGACEGSGVTLVVESKDAAPTISCSKNFTGSGWELLDWAHELEGTLNYPTGFACRIDGYPARAKQDCSDTPTYAEGSWVYFYADPTTEGWAFSGVGSAMRKPACGTAEAWVFSGPNQPESTKPTTEPTVFECSK